MYQYDYEVEIKRANKIGLSLWWWKNSTSSALSFPKRVIYSELSITFKFKID